eukprot:5776336-Pleurochrysis_carterae.AAC.3
MDVMQALHAQGSPRTRWQPVRLRRPRRAALASRSSSQVGLYARKDVEAVSAVLGQSLALGEAQQVRHLGRTEAGGQRAKVEGRLRLKWKRPQRRCYADA